MIERRTLLRGILRRELSEDEAFEALLTHQILMERPIAVRGDRAVVARPPERVRDLL